MKCGPKEEVGEPARAWSLSPEWLRAVAGSCTKDAELSGCHVEFTTPGMRFHASLVYPLDGELAGNCKVYPLPPRLQTLAADAKGSWAGACRRIGSECRVIRVSLSIQAGCEVDKGE